MPASEIDDIFAAKGKGKPAVPVPSSSKAPDTTSSKKNKKNAKKRKREADPAKTPADEVTDHKPVKRRVPETVIDPSASIATASSHAQPPKSVRPPDAKKKHKKPEKEDESRFMDSRGTGSSKSASQDLFQVIMYLASFQDAKRRKDGIFTKRTSSESQSKQAVSTRAPVFQLDLQL